MACETFFAAYLSLRVAHVELHLHFLGRTGLEFHAWRAAYITHLAEVGRQQDLEWVERYLDDPAIHISDDARQQIEKNAPRFRINPDSVIGAEVFISCDEKFQCVDFEINNATPGKLPSDPRARLSGTIDMILLEHDRVIVVDPKTGYATNGVTDDEPIINAVLIFSFFPTVNTVEFRWDFVRVNANRRTTYTRDEDLPWMQARVHELWRDLDALEQKILASKPLEVNPGAGLCQYCFVAPDCPMFTAAGRDRAIIGPVHDDATAKRTAQILAVADAVSKQARDALRPWFAGDHPMVSIGGNMAVVPQVSTTTSYPLVKTLNEVLDIGLVDLSTLTKEQRAEVLKNQPKGSTKWDVPLKDLTADADVLNTAAKTKRSRNKVSRAGLREALDAVADTGSTTKIQVRNISQSEDLVALLEKSIEAAKCRS